MADFGVSDRLLHVDAELAEGTIDGERHAKGARRRAKENSMGGKIAVAGATGRVGRHVVDVLEEQGHEVVAISRSAGVDVVTARVWQTR